MKKQEWIELLKTGWNTLSPLVSCHTCNEGMIAADFLLSKAGNRRAYRKDTYPVFQHRSAKNLRNPSGAREFCRSAALSQNDDAFASPYLFRLAETTKFFSSYLHYRCDMTLDHEEKIISCIQESLHKKAIRDDQCQLYGAGNASEKIAHILTQTVF